MSHMHFKNICNKCSVKVDGGTNVKISMVVVNGKIAITVTCFSEALFKKTKIYEF